MRKAYKMLFGGNMERREEAVIHFTEIWYECAEWFCLVPQRICGRLW
jgi:hypothetical protein